MTEEIKLTPTMKRVYDKMHAQEEYSPLGLTIRVQNGRDHTFYYDVKVQGLDDPHFLLDEYKIVDTNDVGRYVTFQDPETRQSFQIWEKNLKEIKQPRYIETFIRNHGLKNVTIHELGKYHFQAEAVVNIIEGMHDAK